MLSKSSVVIGTNLSEIMVDRGIRLVPKRLTLVNELNTAINGKLGFKNPSTATRDYIPYYLEVASTGDEEVVRGVTNYVSSSHDSFMDNYIADISKLVSGHVSFARTVVNKEINLLKEELQSGLSSYRYKEPEDFFSVNYFKLSEIYSSYIVSNEVSDYAGREKDTYFENMSLRKLTDEGFELDKYLLTGDSEQDSVITAWLAGVGNEKAIGYIVNYIPEYNLSVDQLLDYSLVNYLFYRNLTEKVDLDLGYTISTLRSIASGNRDYFGSKLAIVLELYNKDIRNGRILSSNTDINFSYFNTEPLTITVYEENFRKLAEAGLNIEVVFGYISSGSGGNDITVEQLIQSGAEYIQKWTNTRSLYLISINNNRLDVFKQILSSVFMNSLTRSEMNEDELGYLNEHSGYMDETRKLASAYIDQLHVSDIDDVCTITLDLVAKIRYRFTDSYTLLKNMSEILKMSDDVEPLEAALYATCNYIVDFLMDQVDVVNM